DHVGEDAREEVEVAPAARVVDPVPLATDDLDGLVVVEGDPLGDDGSVARVTVRPAPSIACRAFAVPPATCPGSPCPDYRVTGPGPGVRITRRRYGPCGAGRAPPRPRRARTRR